MFFLILSTLVFVIIFIYLFSAHFRGMSHRTHKTTAARIPAAVDALVSQFPAYSSLFLQIPRRKTSFEITHQGEKIRASLPIVTQRQQSRLRKYMDDCAAEKLNPIVLNFDTKSPVLSLEFDINSPNIGPKIQNIFLILFEVDEDKDLEISLEARRWDDQIFWNLVKPSEITVNVRYWRTYEEFHLRTFNRYRVKIIGTVFTLFLFPPIGIGLYFYVGISCFYIYLMVVWFIFGLGEYYLNISLIKKINPSRLILLILIILSYIYNDPYYVQLSVTFNCCILLLVACASFWPSAPSWLASRRLAAQPDHTMAGTFLLFSISAITINEYIRTTCTIDDWVIFYSFFAHFGLIFLLSTLLLWYTLVFLMTAIHNAMSQ